MKLSIHNEKNAKNTFLPTVGKVGLINTVLMYTTLIDFRCQFQPSCLKLTFQAK
jgi:hypothetical protein